MGVMHGVAMANRAVWQGGAVAPLMGCLVASFASPSHGATDGATAHKECPEHKASEVTAPLLVLTLTLTLIALWSRQRLASNLSPYDVRRNCANY